MIQLLVVIAIIAILAGMLLPALNNSREASRKASCTNQMKTLGLGMAMYAQEWNGHIPGMDGTTAGTNWLTKLGPYIGLGQNPETMYVSGPGKTVSTSNATSNNKRLMYKQNGLSVYCPSITSASPTPGPSNIQYSITTYAQNTHIMAINTPTITSIHNPTNWLKVGNSPLHRPSDAIAHGEYDTKPWFKDSSYKLDFLHNQTGNFSFLDGHVESIKKDVYVLHLWRLSLSY